MGVASRSSALENPAWYRTRVRLSAFTVCMVASGSLSIAQCTSNWDALRPRDAAASDMARGDGSGATDSTILGDATDAVETHTTSCDADLTSSVENCGTCGNACISGQTCSDGGCTCMPPSNAVCNGQCVNTQANITTAGLQQPLSTATRVAGMLRWGVCDRGVSTALGRL